MALTTFARTIVAGSDDASEAPGGVPALTQTGASISVSGIRIGFRFTDIAVPQGATVTSATVGLTLTNTSKNDAEGIWYGELADDAATFTTADDNLDRPGTFAFASWTTNDLGSALTRVSSPNLAAVVQEIVDRPGWTPGNALVLIYEHQSAVDALEFALSEHPTAEGPDLTITFETADYVDPDPIIEFAWGADLDAAPSTWTWSDESERLLPQMLSIKRGRANEASRPQPATVSFDLDNRSGDYTPGNATAAHYPDVDRGAPLRVRMPGGSTDTYLLFDGHVANNVSTPDAATLDVTGSIACWFDGDIDWWRWEPQSALVGKYKAAGDQRSFLFYIASPGLLSFLWSEDGATTGWRWAVCGTNLPWTDGRHAVAVEFDRTAGEVQFYTADTAAGPWVPLGDPVTEDTGGLGTFVGSTIFAGTAPLEIGADTGERSAPPTGKVYSAGVRATDLSGDVRANPDFTAQAAGTTSFADTASTPKTWTLNGDAAIVDLDTRRVRFVGQVDEIAPTWPEGDLSTDDDPGESLSTVSASGFLRRLGQGLRPLASPLFRAHMRPSMPADPHTLLGYWSMEEGTDATQFASPVPGCGPMLFGGEVRPGSDSTNPASESLPTVGAGQPAGWHAFVLPGPNDQWIFTMQVKIPTLLGTFWPLAAIGSEGTVRRWVLFVQTGAYGVKGYDANGTEVFDFSGGPVGFTDGWTQVHFKAEQVGGNIVFDRGWVTADGSVFGGQSSYAGTLGRVVEIANLYPAAPPDGVSFGHMSVVHGVDLDWLGWSEGANRGHVGEEAGLRLQRLAREEGIPLRMTGNPLDTPTMGVQGTSTVLDLMYECVDVDGGVLAEERDRFGLLYRPRTTLYNQTPRLALDARTRDESGLVVSDIVPPFAPVKDDQRLKNDVVVKRVDGSSDRVTTDPPPPASDRYEDEATLNVEADVHLPNQAGWRLHLGTWPGMRYPSVTTDLADAPHLVDAWLDAELGDSVTVDNLPPQHPASTVDLLSEGYDESISEGHWTVGITASPGGPWRPGIREDADEPARRDTDGCVLEDDMSDVDTVALLVIESGLGWTQDPTDYPFDLDIGGERVTATAIDEAGGIPYFEVERSVNGVVKSHTAGTPVRLWRPSFRAL